ncbi:hypothetical protein [Streptomyces wedmorensis]|uniref:hypothetical protein n=1 Tax=Streptomyces wedmorensis TaxID=43759 RepID=UPI00052541E8|nr:hypothetical protein [Streptomyces wedmorensis]
MTTRPFTVADVMTKKVVAVRPGAEFKEIVAAMERWKVERLARAVEGVVDVRCELTAQGVGGDER